jgi:hypothetical protein
MRRREFIKYGGAGLASLVLPAFAWAKKEIVPHEKEQLYRLTRPDHDEHLQTIQIFNENFVTVYLWSIGCERVWRKIPYHTVERLFLKTQKRWRYIVNTPIPETYKSEHNFSSLVTFLDFDTGVDAKIVRQVILGQYAEHQTWRKG